MLLMSSELYDALVEAGTSEKKARKAEESMADYEALFVGVISDIRHMKWAIGTLMVVLVLFIAGTVWIR
jgi:hypothetical protein